MPRQGMGRGRRRGRRWVGALPQCNRFGPEGPPGREVKVIVVSVEELEAMRLVDLEGMQQEEAAAEMGVSRKTLWNDLKSARKKVTEALVNGWAISIEGGNYVLRNRGY